MGPKPGLEQTSPSDRIFEFSEVKNKPFRKVVRKLFLKMSKVKETSAHVLDNGFLDAPKNRI